MPEAQRIPFDADDEDWFVDLDTAAETDDDE